MRIESMVKTKVVKIFFIFCLVGLVSCTRRNPIRETSGYTQIDSLTETYLNLQDSLLITWNVMVKDENEKLRSMDELLTMMQGSGLFDKDQLTELEQRFAQVERIRFNQKTMTNSHVVEEYDFASNSLISEILSMAESNSNFIRKSGVQTLIDYVMTADQRVSYYRSDYDFIAEKFNFFVNKNKRLMKEIDRDSTYEKRPLFQMASDN